MRFGIIGTGRISDWVLKGAVLDPRFEAAAVCSRTREKAQEFAAAHGIGKIYTDIDAIASDPDIDAVYIGTPNHTHHDLAIRCLNHGKHVLCEKPLASNALEVKEMMAAANANGVMLMEAMISTLTPNFRVAAQALKTLGTPRRFFSAYCQYSSRLDLLKRIISGEDCSPVPSSLNPDCSGGALMDIGIYTIYPMVVLFGAPLSIKANVTTCLVPVSGGKKPVDLQGSVLFKYPEMEAVVTYSKIADSNLPTEIACDGGILTLDQIHIARRVWLTPRGIPSSGRSSGPAATEISVPADDDAYLCEFREFIDTVQSGRRESSVNTLATSLAVAEILDEIKGYCASPSYKEIDVSQL
jgi:scyllo-inositol 2-dehydrogenase (NADP+)